MRERIARWIYPEIFEHYYYANKRAEKLDNQMYILSNMIGITDEQIAQGIIEDFKKTNHEAV